MARMVLVPHDSLEASKAMIALSDKNLREEMGKQSRIFCEENLTVIMLIA